MLLSILAFLFIILICVIVHEFGHYITALIFGVKVHEFSFGMGPLLWQSQGRRNKWSIRALPVGGFVRLAGMGEEADGETLLPGESFREKAAWKRLIILAAGAFNNVLLVVVLMTGLLAVRGVMDLSVSEIGELMPDYPAEAAGLQSGDVVFRVGETDVTTWQDMSLAIRAQGQEGKKINLKVRRNGEELDYTLETKRETPDGPFLVGIRPAFKRLPIFKAAGTSITFTFQLTVTMLKSLKSILLHPSKADVTGPVGIAAMAGSAARDGIVSLIAFLAIISLNLGIINLLPFPALDGGHIFFVLCEMITGRRLPQKALGVIQFIGFTLLAMLIVYVTWQDILRLLMPGVQP